MVCCLFLIMLITRKFRRFTTLWHSSCTLSAISIARILWEIDGDGSGVFVERCNTNAPYISKNRCAVYIIGIWNGKRKKQIYEQLYWEIYEIWSNENMGKTTYFIFLVTCSETFFLITKNLFSIFFSSSFLFLFLGRFNNSWVKVLSCSMDLVIHQNLH
jgi:hypothetical protein